MAPSQAHQRQQQATQSALERMAVAYGLPVEAAAPRQPAYTPNYQNPDAVTAALEGILGGTASAVTPSVTAAVTEAVVTPASRHNLRQRPQTRATVAITEARARVRGQGQNEGGAPHIDLPGACPPLTINCPDLPPLLEHHPLLPSMG